jgi:probable phosphoglycerate mutase
MSFVVLIRHGPTAWNAEARIQGQTDTDLSPEGRAAVAGWRLPEAFLGLPAVASPLRRAVATAELLGLAPLAHDSRLMEMHWGAWEGERLPELRQRLGAEMTRNEARGLDFQPPGGESRRMLLARVQDWLAEVAAAGAPCVAVTHAGVIRVVYAAASGWNMVAERPIKFRRAAAHVFTLHPGGGVAVERMNVAPERCARRRAF